MITFFFLKPPGLAPCGLNSFYSEFGIFNLSSVSPSCLRTPLPCWLSGATPSFRIISMILTESGAKPLCTYEFIAWIQQDGSFVTTRQQVEAGLNLLPVPVEISWRLPVSHLEEPSILHVHQSDNLLVSIAGNKHSPHKVKSLLINTSSCGAEQRHHSKDLHLFILLCHFRQETVWNIFRFTMIQAPSILYTWR